MTATITANNRCRRIRTVAVAFLTITSACASAHADVVLGGDLGIGKRYRAGGWIPVTVYVRKSDADPLHGQVQAYADPDPLNKSKQVRPGMSDLGPPPAVFSTQAPLIGPAGSTGAFRLYVRNIDPVEDNLTLQYRSGDERGEGAVLARLPMNSGKATYLSGTPILGSDPWIVAVADDPAAFGLLNGRKLAIAHTHSGPREISTLPKARNPNATAFQSALMMPSVQATPASVPELPDKAAGYEGVDAVMLRCDAPLAGLTEAQGAALRDWVAAGGHLVITSGADPSGLTASLLRDMLPASVNPGTRNVAFEYPGGGNVVGNVAAVVLTPKPLPGVRVLVASGTAPLVVSGSYGLGRVTVTAFDPTTNAFRLWQGGGSARFWRDLITGGDTRPSSILGYVAGREEADSSYNYYGNDAQLASALLRVPSLDAPQVSTIAIYLLVYIIVLVPVNYLVLKRLDRREWAWATIPALVVLFAGGTYAIGYMAKGGTMFVNRVLIAETSAGSSVAGVYSAFGIFSPHRRVYDIAVKDPNALICQPNTFHGFYGMSQDTWDLAGSDPARFLQGGSDPAIQDVSINMWAMRRFDVSSAGDLGGAIMGRLTLARPGARGVLRNGTGYTLKDCWICYRGTANAVGDFAPGAHLTVNINGVSSRSGERDDFPDTAFASSDYSDDFNPGNVGARMKTGTVQFLKTLGVGDNYYASAPSASSEPSTAYKPRPNEAILAGWAQGRGPLDTGISIDGATATENDVTLVIVHIPVDGSQAGAPSHGVDGGGS